uniref:Wall-associated receptor kinase galacturonan-binding domain-containing protein n=1 Tax=Setaria viridis TaxID=4556 RepID=A0A4V6D8T8_SETVI|nr:hypothetical protein SEVIR_4G291201v2 [Setaria viridis]
MLLLMNNLMFRCVDARSSFAGDPSCGAINRNATIYCSRKQEFPYNNQYQLYKTVA